ncbi:hypothetical protein ACJJIG_18080 [Microbulbifer sp. SSSA007]|uniref:hypothetical protein n=1 Tax=Microbulbifer TaxID=48073 RepID=UPI000369D709|nr:hypothetical protein [Microbulbifer variabilis]
MPFSEPWRRYCSGDFFYGFSGSRARLIQQLTQRTMQDFASNNTVAWLDQLLTGTAVHDCHYLNEDFNNFCRSKEKYKCVVSDDSSIEPPQTGEESVDNKRFRRKSKAGIEFLVKHHHFIHFAIDYDMDWNAVITKPGQGEGMVEAKFPFERKTMYQYDFGEGLKNRVITYAEIRFIFRNRNDADFMKRIQFWYRDTANPDSAFSPEAPPWERYPDIWQNYKPKSEA